MKRVTYTGDQAAVTIQTEEWDYVLRPGGEGVEVPNDIGAKYEGKEGFTVRDIKAKKGDS